jgi:hypothetical protein
MINSSDLQRILLQTMVTCNWPFDQFDVEIFRHLLHRGFPGHKIHNRRVIRGYLKTGAIKAREEIKSRFRSHDGRISLVLDCWTSSNRHEFMGTDLPISDAVCSLTTYLNPWVTTFCHAIYTLQSQTDRIAITSHFIDKDFVYHKDLLSFCDLPMIHSGVNLANHVHGILHEFNFYTKLFCITTDSASNNVKMMKELAKLLRKDGITWNGLDHHIWCLAHVINLAVKAFLSNLKATPTTEEDQWLSGVDRQESVGGEESDIEEDDDLYGNNNEDIDENLDAPPSLIIKEGEGFETVLLKIHEIWKATTMTPKRIQSFKNVCTATHIKPLRPIRDHAIRWNATFNMLERALYLHKAIDLWTL